MAGADFSIYSGDSRQLNVSILDANNNQVNLTGANVKWVLVDTTATVLSKSIGNGITITNALQGQCTISITSAETQSLNGTYTHEARVIDSSGNSSIVFSGSVTVTKAYV